MNENENEIEQNLGDLFKTSQKETKMGTKITDLEDLIQEGLKIVKQIKPEISYPDNRNKLIELFTLFYKGHHLEKKMLSLEWIPHNNSVTKNAWECILSKENSLAKLKKIMED